MTRITWPDIALILWLLEGLIGLLIAPVYRLGERTEP